MFGSVTHSSSPALLAACLASKGSTPSVLVSLCSIKVTANSNWYIYELRLSDSSPVRTVFNKQVL